MHSFLRSIAAAALLWAATACFTGIDSTPTIKAPKPDESVGGGRPEIHYLDNIEPLEPSQWKIGKTSWRVTAPEFGLLFTPEVLNPRLAGATVTFMGFQPSVSIAGDTVTNILLRLPDNSIHPWTVNRSLSEVEGLQKLQIPYTIDLAMVEQASGRLNGKHLWLLTREWRDSLDNPLPDGPFPKFVEVTIDQVAPGTDLYPIRLRFPRPDGQGNAYLFLSTAKDIYSGRTFAGQWRLTDPRMEHKRISDDDWTLIIKGQTAPGMTMDLVRLSLGAPERIDRRTAGSILVQTWFYPSGQTLRFEDGILVPDP